MGYQYSVNKCASCDQWYCMECCNHKEWQEFCSTACAKDAKEALEAEAIDEAAMRLGESSADDYMAGWTRSAWEEFGGDPVQAAQDRSEALDLEWTQERLDAYLDSLG